MELHGSQDERIGGARLTGGSRATVHGRDRVCAHQACDVRLSIYNPSDRCALHDPPAARQPGAQPSRTAASVRDGA